VLQPARGHIYLSHRSTVVVVASARRTPQSPLARYISPAISANCPEPEFRGHPVN